MLLDEAATPAQLKAALKEGDTELKADVRKQIRDKVIRAYDHAITEWDDMTAEEAIYRVEHAFDGDLMGIINALDADDVERVLRTVPEDRVRSALRDEVEVAGEKLEQWMHGRTRGRQLPSSVLFEFAGGQGGGIRLGPIHNSIRVNLDDPLSWVPAEYVLEVLKDEGPYGAAWEELEDDVYDSGWFEVDDELRMEFKRDDFIEWAQDLRQEYHYELVDAEPAQAIAAFLSELEDFPELARRVKKAKLPKDVLADYAGTYFQDPEEGIEILSEAMGVFGYEGSKAPTIIELDADTLRRLGVHHGRWEHGAPWRLADLPPEELAYEGTLMRHCVGRHGMGYREAVARGDTAIWSLRSRFERPVLTFEIARRQWDSAKDSPAIAPRIRGDAIKQIKGKLNRLAGEDPDEAVVLEWLFDQLGVDPRAVRDFARSRAANPTGSFCAPWRPYGERNMAEPRAKNPKFARLRQRLENPWEYERHVRALTDLPRGQQANLYGAMQALQKARRDVLEAERAGDEAMAREHRELAHRIEQDLRDLERIYGIEPGMRAEV